MDLQRDKGHIERAKNCLAEAVPVHGGQSAGSSRRYMKEMAQQSPREEVLERWPVSTPDPIENLWSQMTHLQRQGCATLMAILKKVTH